MDAFDDVVVGAGPTGAATAWRHAQLGHQAAVVERALLPSVSMAGRA